MNLFNFIFGKKITQAVVNQAVTHNALDRRAMIRISENALNFRMAFRTCDWDETLPESRSARRFYSGNST